MVRFCCSKIGLGIFSIISLVIGVLLYLITRKLDSLYLSNALHFHNLPAWFPNLISDELKLLFGSLPTAIHVFSFSILTALSLGLKERNILTACIIWAVINIGFEAIQILDSCPLIFQAENIFNYTLCAYISNGVFDWFDVASALIGAAFAYVLMSKCTKLWQ